MMMSSKGEEMEQDMAGIRRPRKRNAAAPATKLTPATLTMSERKEVESSYASLLVKKTLLLPPLLLALYLLEDHVQQHQQNNSNNHDDLMTGGKKLEGAHAMIARNMPAFITSLRAHPPSLRVFRALSELCLVLFCAATCLRVWETTRVKMRHAVARTEEDGGNKGGAEEVQYEEEEVGINDIIGQLLFQPYDDKSNAATDTPTLHDGIMDEEEEHGVEPLLLLNEEDDDHKQKTLESTAEMASVTSDASSLSPNVYFPPPAAAVASSAMDVLLLMLLFLIFFTVSSREVVALAVASAQSTSFTNSDNTTDLNNADAAHLNGAAMFLRNISVTLSAVAAPFFPLLLSFWIVVWCVVPWSKRRGFWLTVMRTVETPFHDVTFRDGLIGDVLTSTVRPLQDIAYTLFYVTAGLQGWWSSLYSLDDADRPLEKNWLLHVIVLPACMISPLWWRFVQNLRQAYDGKKRWPYLGNALKYLLAAEVALFGVFDPSNKQRVLWIGCFFFATLYQVFWDVFMDWELFALQPNDDTSNQKKSRSSALVVVSSSSWKLTMRERRLYRSTSLYWTIFVINVLLRFCWTLSFIPAKYLTRSGRVVEAFSAGLQSFVVPAVACAEIIRRTLWALLRVELEAMKELQRREQAEVDRMDADRLLHQQKEQSSSGTGGGKSDADGAKEGGKKSIMSMDMDMDDMKPMAVGSSAGLGFGFDAANSFRRQPWGVTLFCSDMSTMTDNQILAELSLWATVFTSLGIFAAAQRQG